MIAKQGKYAISGIIYHAVQLLHVSKQLKYNIDDSMRKYDIAIVDSNDVMWPE